MKLKIPKDKAIQIIRQRISELSSLNFNAKAWKDRAIIDMKEIFPVGSHQWLQISNISFDTYVTSEKQKVLREGKDTARQLLNSYIDFIEQYSSISTEREVIEEDNYKKKYNDLLTEWNDLVPEYNELAKKHSNLQTEHDGLTVRLEELNIEMQSIKSNTVQFDNITLSKLFKALGNLPIGQTFALVLIIISITGGSFGLGKLYQENISNSSHFELKQENNRLQEKMKSLENENSSLQTKLDEKNQQLDSLKSAKMPNNR